MSSYLDPAQIIKQAYDEVNQAIQVKSVAGGFVTSPYDEIDLTYVPSGNGAGQIQTVVYKLSGNVINTLTLTYNSANNIITVVKT